jgi:hypothetical protein
VIPVIPKSSLQNVRIWTAFSFLIPVLAFGISSFKYPQGLHWTVSFYPFAYLWAGLALTGESLRRGFKVSLVATLVLFGVAIAGALKSDESWRQTIGGAPIRFSRYIISRRPEVLVNFLRAEQAHLLAETGKDATQIEWATDSYTTASTFDFYRGEGKRVWVLGYGTRFGRHFDWNQPIREWAGKDFLILGVNVGLEHEIRDAFDSVERSDIEIAGAPFVYIKARGFKPDAYAKKFLKPAYEKYYELPPEVWQLGCPRKI